MATLIAAGLLAVLLSALLGMLVNWIPKPDQLSRTVHLILVGLVGLALALVTVAGLISKEKQQGDEPKVVIQTPAPEAMVAIPTALNGTISDKLAKGYTLWASIQAVDESKHHPQDRECVVTGSIFNCPELYVGGPQDAKKSFVLTLIDADPAATAALRNYGSRDKTGPDAYVGLAALPHSTEALAAQRVKRA